MLPQLKFLIVDFHAESRFLLVRTLRRKFPAAQIDEFEEAAGAIERVARGDLHAIITHRTFDESGADLVRRFRHASPNIPIVMVSGIDRSEAALEAGADLFLHYDEWLRVGTVVEQLLERAGSQRPDDAPGLSPSPTA